MENGWITSRGEHFSCGFVNQLYKFRRHELSLSSQKFISCGQHGECPNKPAVAEGSLFDLVCGGVSLDELRIDTFVEILAGAEPFNLFWVRVTLRLDSVTIH